MKKLKSNFYSIGKCDANNCYSMDDKPLYSNGRHKTRLKSSDLPEWYILGMYYEHLGYMSCKGVKCLELTVKKFTNHLFRDCFLCVTYSNKLPNSDEFEVQMIRGNSITEFLIGCQKYGYDISDIQQGMNQHIIELKERCDEEWTSTISSFDDIINSMKQLQKKVGRF